MKTKHTPAPWRLMRDPCHFDSLTTVEGGVVGLRKPFDVQMVVQVGGAADIFEAEANARLISAAPDLLSVAMEMDECAAYWSEYDVPIGIHDRIKAAIAKAFGHNA